MSAAITGKSGEKEILPALLVGQIGAATIENSMEVP